MKEHTILYPDHQSASSEHEEMPKRCPGSSCCSCRLSSKCCCLSSLFCVVSTVVCLGILLLVSYFVLKGMAESQQKAALGNNKEWERILAADSNSSSSRSLKIGDSDNSDDISVLYELVSVTGDYGQFLDLMEIPSFVKPFILSSKQLLNITVIRESQGKERWLVNRTLILPIGFQKKIDSEFVLGEEYVSPWGEDRGFFHGVCKKTEVNVLSCLHEEQLRGWKLSSKKTFSDFGMVHRQEITPQINDFFEYTEYFKRLGKKDVEEIKRTLGGAGKTDINSGSNSFEMDDAGIDEEFFEEDKENVEFDDFFQPEDHSSF